MALECELVHGIRDRARIRVDTHDVFNGLESRFQAYLGDQAGIRSVRINASCRSVIVNFDPDRLGPDSLVDLIQQVSLEELEGYSSTLEAATGSKGGEGSSRAQPTGARPVLSIVEERPARRRAKHVPPRSARGNVSVLPWVRGERATEREQAPRGELNCSLVHGIGDRVRIRVESHQVFNGLRGRLESFLRDRPGVRAVRVNPGCRSVIVTFDPDELDPEGVLLIFEEISVEVLAEYPVREAPTTSHPLPDSWKPLALSGAAVGLGLAGAPLAPWLLVAGVAVPIFVRAVRTVISKRKLNVDVLDAGAISVMLVQGQVQGAAVMLSLIWLGDLIRDLTVQRAHSALEEPFSGKFRSCWVERDGRKVRVDVEELKPGEEVVVYPGELIPVDGKVIEGKAAVDQKILTGESMPVDKGIGEEVFAATAVSAGDLRVLPERVGDETAAARIIRFVRDAPTRETRVQNYAERMADRIAPWSLAGAGVALGFRDLNRASSLLAVEYGTGIRIAAPTTVMASMTKAARRGILIKGGAYLEKLSEVGAVVFDKTGTLTMGVPEVAKVLPSGDGAPPERVLELAVAAEQRLTHPMAEAIERAARSRGIEIPERESFDYHIGLGVEAIVEGERVLAGSHRFLAEKGIPLNAEAADLRAIRAHGGSEIFIALKDSLVGVVVVTDPLRPEAAEVVRALRDRGVREVAMLTGDHPDIAARVASEVGISTYVAESLPEQKAEYVRDLQREGYSPVAVVGDGINDSPALVQADVGIAVGGGADIAQHAAHVALQQDNLWQIPDAIDIAREGISIIKQDWKLISYPNTLAIGLALVGLIGPAAASLIHNGGSTLAAVNSLRPLFGHPRE